MTNQQYLEMKQTIEAQIEIQQRSLVDTEQDQIDWLTKVESFFDLSQRLVRTYERATVEDKRIIMDLVSTRFILIHDKLNLELAETYKALFEAKQRIQSIRTAKKLVTESKKALSEAEKVIWQAQ